MSFVTLTIDIDVEVKFSVCRLKLPFFPLGIWSILVYNAGRLSFYPSLFALLKSLVIAVKNE